MFRALSALAAAGLAAATLALLSNDPAPSGAQIQTLVACQPAAAVTYTSNGTARSGFIWAVAGDRALVRRAGSSATTHEDVACSALTFPGAGTGPSGPSGPSGPTGPSDPPPTPAGLTNGCTGSTTVITQNTSGKLFRCAVVIRGNGLTITGNKFEGTGRAATFSQPDVQVWAQNVTGLTFTANELTGNNMHALLYTSGSRDVYVSRNDFHDTGSLDPAKANLSHALYLDGCSSCRIVNNRIERVTSFGIQLGDDGANDVQIDNNVIGPVGRSGVILWANTSRALITSNWFRDNAQAVTSYALTGTGNSVAAPNWATGTGALLTGSGYTKSALTLSAPPADWTVPAPVRFP